MAHSQSASFTDDYNTSSPTRDDASHDPAGDLEHTPQHAQPARHQASLAKIHIPSFRSFASSIPVPSPSTRKSKPAPFHLPARSPRAASFSLAERASPRLADPSSRPLSLDSPLPQQPDGLATAIPPPSTEQDRR
ncbi:hypothetical protein LTR53_013843 [Teratosphaeriaceae sp. CCFEE 6253]|nr:hypothetical protein LTR53_013843 [Teratosphaeriaceae sp. CCFEE 6253]